MQRVATLADLTEGRPLAAELDGQKIVLVRDGGQIHALAGECPHAGAPLAEGAVCGGRLVCPWHKAVFQLDDGSVIEPPALSPLQRYPVGVEQDAIFVDPTPVPGPIPRASPAPAAANGPLVIVGAGAAGAAAAAALREFGFDGELVLIGTENRAPYDRTALSKFVLAGEMPPDEVPPLLEHPPRLHRIVGEVAALDATQRTIRMRDGQTLRYHAALIATGGAPQRPDLPGTDLPGILTLRDATDAAAITDAAPEGAPIVIVGSGFIGLEAASALRKRGCDVTIVMTQPVPFEAQFGARIGKFFKALHEANGVKFRPETQVTSIEGDTRVQRVVLDDGSALPARLVLLGTGVRPATAFLHGIERDEDGGLPVDQHMRVTTGLYAAGDIARFPLADGTRVRIEHWRVAQQHARLAARNMLGGTERYAGVPFFWTYHFGKRFEYLGHATHWDEIVLEGDLDQAHFIAFFVQAGTVAAALACGRERATAYLIERLRTPLPLDEAQALCNPTA